jgi:FtsZ-binding cell division protein ZapB
MPTGHKDMYMPDNVRQLLVAKVKSGEANLQRARNEISELKNTNQRLTKRLAEAQFTHGALSLELGALKSGQAGMRAEVRSALRRADAAAVHSEKRCATAIEAMQAECASRAVLHEVNEQTAREHYQILESKRAAGIDAAATRESTLQTEIEHLQERTQATATEHLQSITEYIEQVVHTLDSRSRSVKGVERLYKLLAYTKYHRAHIL